MYSPEELAEIQDVIAGKAALLPEQEESIRQGLLPSQTPACLWPFVPLYATNQPLFRKLAADPKVAQFSFFGFFPCSYPVVYGNDGAPAAGFVRGNRGLACLLRHPSGNLVIKPLQNSRETEIAGIAAEEMAGPAQYPSLDHFLTEEFIKGEFFTQLQGERASPEHAESLGRRLGEILTRLHGREVLYNDTVLADDFGKCHYLIPASTPARLIDFCVALSLDHHPDFTDEEIFTFGRTTPEAQLMALGLPSDGAYARAVIGHFRPLMRRSSKSELLARDLNFVHEGIAFAQDRIRAPIRAPFLSGFKEAYSG